MGNMSNRLHSSSGSMLTSVRIQNFRCFKDFSLENPGQVTLVGGKNNVGKTSLLEAIFLLFACGNPNIFVQMNIIRGNFLTVFSPDITWEHLFYNKDIDNNIKLSAKENGNLISAEFQSERDTSNAVPIVLPPDKKINILSNSYPLKITCQYNNEDICVGYCFPLQEGMTINWHKGPQNHLLPRVSYIGFGQGDQQNLAMHFGNLVKSGKKQEVIEALELLEPDLIDISTVAEDIPRLYIQRKDKNPLPLSVMGNGIYRFAQIVFSMLESPGGIILIDEIEAGFHYSFFDKLWKTIESLSNKLGIQVFATTHSLECAYSAIATIENNEKLLYLRLNNDNGSVVPYIFPPDSLLYSFNNDIEIR